MDKLQQTLKTYNFFSSSERIMFNKLCVNQHSLKVHTPKTITEPHTNNNDDNHTFLSFDSKIQ